MSKLHIVNHIGRGHGVFDLTSMLFAPHICFNVQFKL